MCPIPSLSHWVTPQGFQCQGVGSAQAGLNQLLLPGYKLPGLVVQANQARPSLARWKGSIRIVKSFSLLLTYLKLNHRTKNLFQLLLEPCETQCPEHFPGEVTHRDVQEGEIWEALPALTEHLIPPGRNEALLCWGTASCIVVLQHKHLIPVCDAERRVVWAEGRCLGSEGSRVGSVCDN